MWPSILSIPIEHSAKRTGGLVGFLVTELAASEAYRYGYDKEHLQKLLSQQGLDGLDELRKTVRGLKLDILPFAPQNALCKPVELLIRMKDESIQELFSFSSK